MPGFRAKVLEIVTSRRGGDDLVLGADAQLDGSLGNPQSEFGVGMSAEVGDLLGAAMGVEPDPAFAGVETAEDDEAGAGDALR